MKIVPFNAREKDNIEVILPVDKSDDELMLLARDGMSPAFDPLIRRHQSMVFRIAMKYLGKENDAKDVTQNSFVEVHRYLRSYKPQGKFVSYLGRIVLNQCKMVN